MLGVTLGDGVSSLRASVPQLEVSNWDISAVVTDGDAIKDGELCGYVDPAHIVVLQAVSGQVSLPRIPANTVNPINAIDAVLVQLASL